jgi:hypothetical protein
VDGSDVLQTGSSNVQRSGNRGRLRDTVGGLPAATKFLFWLNWTVGELLRAVLGDGSFDAGDVRFRRESAKAEGLCCLLFQQRTVLRSTAEFMDGAKASEGRIEAFGWDGVALWTKAHRSN